MMKNIFVIGIACLCVGLVFAQTFQQQCLTAHNAYRKQHGAPNLTLNSTITAFAQQWANYLAKTSVLQHRQPNIYGENLYAMYGSGSTTVNGSVAVKAWYDEIKDYNYNSPGFSSKTGHFTQVVWKNSRQLGCAVAKNGTRTYVVANYSPPGNYLGQFPANVLKKQ